MPALYRILRKIITISCIAALGYTAAAQAQEISFTTQQADNGKELYKQSCQICHGNTMMNGQFGTPLRGSFFRKKWSGKSLGEMLQFTVESMPPDNKMSLTPEQYAELVSYILSRNAIEPSDVQMASDPALHTDVLLPW